MFSLARTEFELTKTLMLLILRPQASLITKELKVLATQMPTLVLDVLKEAEAGLLRELSTFRTTLHVSLQRGSDDLVLTNQQLESATRTAAIQDGAIEMWGAQLPPFVSSSISDVHSRVVLLPDLVGLIERSPFRDIVENVRPIVFESMIMKHALAFKCAFQVTLVHVSNRLSQIPHLRSCCAEKLYSRLKRALRVTCGRAQQRQARATMANAAARYRPRCVVNSHGASLAYSGSLGKGRVLAAIRHNRSGERVSDADGVGGGDAAVPHAVCRGEFLLKDSLHRVLCQWDPHPSAGCTYSPRTTNHGPHRLYDCKSNMA